MLCVENYLLNKPLQWNCSSWQYLSGANHFQDGPLGPWIKWWVVFLPFRSLAPPKRSTRISGEQGHLLTPTAEAKPNICTSDHIAQRDTASLSAVGLCSAASPHRQAQVHIRMTFLRMKRIVVLTKWQCWRIVPPLKWTSMPHSRKTVELSP